MHRQSLRMSQNRRRSTHDVHMERRKDSISSYTTSPNAQANINIEDDQNKVGPTGKKHKGKSITSSDEISDAISLEG
ncbi:hypothetical protein L1887_38018 [Cichorium endivia]|nr:hypothetical protein L1887_38018 [Cichorium endivia]